MARPQSELQVLLKSLPGVEQAYIQAPTKMEYPCIMIERDDTSAEFADNVKYVYWKGYTVIVVDRDPMSLIPDAVEALPMTRFVRFYRANGLNHFVFHIFF